MANDTVEVHLSSEVLALQDIPIQYGMLRGVSENALAGNEGK